MKNKSKKLLGTSRHELPEFLFKILHMHRIIRTQKHLPSRILRIFGIFKNLHWLFSSIELNVEIKNKVNKTKVPVKSHRSIKRKWGYRSLDLSNLSFIAISQRESACSLENNQDFTQHRWSRKDSSLRRQIRQRFLPIKN